MDKKNKIYIGAGAGAIVLIFIIGYFFMGNKDEKEIDVVKIPEPVSSPVVIPVQEV